MTTLRQSGIRTTMGRELANLTMAQAVALVQDGQLRLWWDASDRRIRGDASGASPASAL